MFIIELRKILGDITINQLILEMGWTNDKYYSKIVNGYICKKTLKRKYSNPTVNYIFGGIKHAMNYYDHWKEQKIKIKNLINEHFTNW